MKFLIIGLMLVSGLSIAAPHLPLEMSFEEYQAWYQELNKTEKLKIDNNYVKLSIAGGEKMSNWVKLINTKRSDENKIRLTSKSTQRGIPVDSPSEYGPSTIERDYKEFKTTIPAVLYNVFYGDEEISESPLVTDEEFIKWARKVSKLYQSAVRWTGMQPWLGHYAGRMKNDIRGFYHLKKIADLDKYLTDYSGLSAEELESLKKHLKGICYNKEADDKKCEASLVEALKRNDLVSYKNKYWKNSQKIWNSFFEISDRRRDVKWDSKNPGLMVIPFKEPKDTRIAQWLKENVEDEFKREALPWTMEIDFVGGGWSTAYLEFKKNVTPHVSGGNKIVMDANTELEEYGVRWTIRHEFGHILRIPDCYHEFYDKKQNLMINYQLDITDLMCSRKGAMNDRIYEELKRHYFKK